MEPSPPTPPAPKEVIEKPVYILVTVQVAKETLETGSSPVSRPTRQNRKVVSLSRYYMEVVIGQRVKSPTKTSKQTGYDGCGPKTRRRG